MLVRKPKPGRMAVGPTLAVAGALLLGACGDDRTDPRAEFYTKAPLERPGLFVHTEDPSEVAGLVAPNVRGAAPPPEVAGEAEVLPPAPPPGGAEEAGPPPGGAAGAGAEGAGAEPAAAGDPPAADPDPESAPPDR